MNDPNSLIKVTTIGHVAVVTIDRPDKRNALVPEMMVKLAATWDQLAANRTVRCVVLTGAGDQAFCAGGDLDRLIPLYTGEREVEDEWDQALKDDPSIWDRAMLRGVGFLKPVIVAINGPAFAGGAELVLASDIRIMSDRASLAFTEVRRGMIAGGGALSRLHRQIGWANAMELMLVAEPCDARRARELGIVNEVAAPADVMRVALEMAERVALGAPVALEKAKEAMLLTTGLPLLEAFEIETSLTAIVSATQDAREGPRAFMQKRRPEFQGC